MGLDRKDPGDSLVWSAATYNRWASAVNALLRGGADQHFGLTAGPDGRQIGREAEGLWAKLAGSGPTYTATEQVRDRATAAWVDGPRGLTGVVEVNAVAGLAGTVQFVEPSTSPGEWLFQSVKLGASATACGTITFTAFGCNSLALPGATVTVYDGSNNTFPVLGTGTTNSLGKYVQSISAAKTYFYEISKSRFTTGTGTVVAACSGSSNTNANKVLAIDSTSYVCAWSVCPDPAPKTLYVNDPVFAVLVTLTWNATSSWWTGTHGFTTNAYPNTCTGSLTSQTVTMAYRFAPSVLGGTTARYQLQIDEPECFVGGAWWPKANASGPTEFVNLATPANLTACRPIAETVILDFSGGTSNSGATANVLQAVYGSGTQTFTISE